MNFDLPTIGGIVRRLAGKLVPGWTVECALATREEAAEGWLAKVDAHPERTMARIVVAPHPPDEDYEETIAHELTHVMLSPLTQLVKRSGALTMLEEQITERLCKLLVDAPDKFRRAVKSAVHNPRTSSPVVRFRISALATRRRIAERKRMDPKMIEEIIAAIREGNGDAAIELLTKLLASAAGGMVDGGEPDSAPTMREDEPAKTEPQMREEDVPEAMRAQYRMVAFAATSSFDSMKRLKLHEIRTVDRLDLSPAIEARLRKARTPEEFEERVSLVRETLSSGDTRKRSGVKANASDINGAPSLESMAADGIPEPVARHVRAEFARGKAHGDAAMKVASQYRKKASHG